MERETGDNIFKQEDNGETDIKNFTNVFEKYNTTYNQISNVFGIIKTNNNSNSNYRLKIKSEINNTSDKEVIFRWVEIYFIFCILNAKGNYSSSSNPILSKSCLLELSGLKTFDNIDKIFSLLTDNFNNQIKLGSFIYNKKKSLFELISDTKFTSVHNSKNANNQNSKANLKMNNKSTSLNANQITIEQNMNSKIDFLSFIESLFNKDKLDSNPNKTNKLHWYI